MSKPDVLCIVTSKFKAKLESANYLCTGQVPCDEVIAILAACEPRWVPREQAETDPTLLQLIPYIQATTGDKVLAYQRKGGGEGRLEAKWSVGIGGHIERQDDVLPAHMFGLVNIIYLAAVRELCEETLLTTAEHYDLPRLEIAGLIYSGDHELANEVDKVHLGISIIGQAPSTAAVVPVSGYEGMGEYKWIADSEVDDMYDKLELWSQLVIDTCFF